MSITLSLSGIVVALVISGFAALGWWVATAVLKWRPWTCVWVLGFILLALSLSVRVP